MKLNYRTLTDAKFEKCGDGEVSGKILKNLSGWVKQLLSTKGITEEDLLKTPREELTEELFNAQCILKYYFMKEVQ
jgi:hypothetical protein